MANSAMASIPPLSVTSMLFARRTTLSTPSGNPDAEDESMMRSARTRLPQDESVAGRQRLDVRLPHARVAADAVGQQDRLAAAVLFVVDPDTVTRGRVSHGILRMRIVANSDCGTRGPYGTIVRGRSQAAPARAGPDSPRGGHPRYHQGPPPVRRVLCRRIPGSARVPSARRHGRRQRVRAQAHGRLP